MNDYNKLKAFFDSDHELTDGEILTAFIKSLELKLEKKLKILPDYEDYEGCKNKQMEISILSACAKAIEYLYARSSYVRERRLARSNLLIDIADIEVIK